MKKIIYFSLAIIALASCQKDIEIDLNDASPNIVIEANYTAEDSTVSVHVTQTSNYFSTDPSLELDNAVITITDQNGIGQNVVSTGNGYYLLENYAPQFNTTYTLNVIHAGSSYSANCFMASSVQLDEITFDWNPGIFGSDPGFMVYLNLMDPADTVNFYSAIITVNGDEYSGLGEGFIQDDLLTDGNYLSRPLFGGPQLDSTDVVGMELRSIDESMYNYINEIVSIIGGSDSAAPGNPTTNWDNNALGYFSAYSSTRKEVVLP